MKNKVLVKLIVPDIDETYDIFLPINKKIGEIIILITKSINEHEIIDLPNNKILYNRSTGKNYEPNVLIKNTDIRNGTNLILL